MGRKTQALVSPFCWLKASNVMLTTAVLGMQQVELTNALKCAELNLAVNSLTTILMMVSAYIAILMALTVLKGSGGVAGMTSGPLTVDLVTLTEMMRKKSRSLI